MISGSGSTGFQQRRSTKLLCGFLALLMLGVWGVAGTATSPASAATPLDAPTNLLPSGSTVTANPTFTWNAVSGASYYKVSYPNTAGTGTTITNTYTNSFSPPTELPTGSVTWTVVAYNGVDGASASATFTKNPAAAPTLSCPGPTVIYPAQTPTFTWTAVPGVKTYTLKVSSASNFPSGNDVNGKPLTNTYSTQATSFTLTAGQSDGQSYYAQVAGATAGGINTPPSSLCTYQVVWSTTGHDLNDAMPTLSSPTNHAQLSDVVLKWQPLLGAARYEVQVSPNPDFQNNLLYDIVTDSTVWSPAKTLNNASYYWRVRGIDNAGNNSLWSDNSATAWQFTRKPYAAPTLLSPANGSLKNDNLMLSWTQVPGAGAYEVQVDTDQNFSNFSSQAYAIAHTCLTTHTDWGPYTYETPPGQFAGPGGPGGCPLNITVQTGRTDGVPLYWRVRAIDDYTQNELTDPWSTSAFTLNHPPAAAINGLWSSTFKFEYHTTSPFDAPVSGPNLVSPGNGASVTVPRLTWNLVPGTQYYKVTIYKNGNVFWTASTAATSYVPDLQQRNETFPVTYTWAVQAVDYNGRVGPMPFARSFTWTGYQTGTATATITPSAPSPADNATVSGIPSFAWNPIAGADHYVFAWFDSYGSNTYIAITDQNRGGNQADPTSEAFTPTQPLDAGAHAWQIFAVNGTGTVIASSAKMHIDVASSLSPGVPAGTTTRVGASNVPCGVSLYSGCNVSSTPLLSWQRNAAASFYRVYIANDPGFTNAVRIYDTAQVSLRPVEALPDNTAGQSYYWYVQSCTTDWKNTAGVLCGPAPSDQINAALPGTYTFAAFHKQSAAVTGLKTLDPTSAASNPSSSACDDATNKTTVSDVPTFCWNGLSTTPYASADLGAMTYHLQVSNTPDFSNILDQVWVDQASYTPYYWPTNASGGYGPGSTVTPPSSQSIRDRTYPDGPLYWRVQAVDASGNALTYSDAQTVTKTSTAVTLSAPANAATVSTTPALSWQAKPFAARYAVEVYRNGDTSASPGNRAFSQLTDLTSITPSNNNQLNGGTSLPQGTYAWRVRGIDGGGNGASWSAWRTFTVSPPGVSLLQPADNSVFTTQSAVSFGWTSVDGAVKYHIYVSSNSTNPRTSANLGNLDTVMTSWSPSVQFPNSATIYWQVDALDAQNTILSTSEIRHFTFDGTRPTIVSPVASAQDTSVLLTWQASKVAAVGPITSFTITATDNSASPKTSIPRTVSPSTSVGPPGSGGGGGNTVCNSATPLQCAYVFTGLTNTHNYSFVITPNDANGPGNTSAVVSAKPGGFGPFTSATNCVKRLWSDLEGVNTPTSGQVSVYVNYINAGHTCADVAGLMWQSGAFLDQFPIARLYQAYFLRIPDYGGLTYWIGLHRTRGYKTSFMSDFFVQSQEFKDTYGSLSNADYVALVYENVLNRDGRTYDPKGYNYWLDKLNKKTINRGQLMLLFSESAEYVKVQMPTMKAELLVLEFLRRTPTQAEVNYYKSQMAPIKDNPATYDAQVQAQIRTIMFTTEYKARAN